MTGYDRVRGPGPMESVVTAAGIFPSRHARAMRGGYNGHNATAWLAKHKRTATYTERAYGIPAGWITRPA